MKSLVFGTAFLLLFLYSCSENNDYTREETLTNETEGSEIDTSRDSLSAENTYATKSAPLFIRNSDSWLKLPLYFSTLEKTRETTRRALTKVDTIDYPLEENIITIENYELPTTLTITQTNNPVIEPIWKKTAPPRFKDNASYDMRCISPDEGLPSSEVNDIFKDSRGFIWLATPNGLLRYNGSHVKQYQKENGLMENEINCIKEDSKGNIWLGLATNVLVRFDGSSFTHFQLDSLGTQRSISDISFDNNGEAWCSVNFGGIVHLKGDSYDLFNAKQGVVDHRPITGIHIDEKNQVWASGFGKGLYVINNDTLKIFNRPVPLYLHSFLKEDSSIFLAPYSTSIQELKNNKFYSYHFDFKPQFGFTNALRDKYGDYWLTTGVYGIAKWDGHELNVFGLPEGVLSENTTSISQDEDQLFIGTSDQGFFTFKPSSFHFLNEKDGLPNKVVHHISQNKNNEYLIGTAQGMVILNDSTAHIIDTYERENNEGKMIDYSLEKHVLDIYSDTSDRVFAAFNNSGIKGLLLGQKKIGIMGGNMKNGPQNPTSIARTSDGKYWVATHSGGHFYVIQNDSLFHFNRNHNLLSNKMTDLIADGDDNVWIASEDYGVICFEDQSNFRYYSEKDGLPSIAISTLYLDGQQNIWAGTSEGLAVKKKNERKFQTISFPDYIKSKRIKAIIQDDLGRFWITTEQGLVMMKIDKQLTPVYFDYFDKNRGLINHTFLANSIHIDHKNTLMAGTEGGLMTYQLDQYAPEDDAPEVFIESISINGTIESFREKGAYQFDEVSPFLNLPLGLALNHDQNHIVFNFASFGNILQTLSYHYKLEGFDTDWNTTQGTHFAEYRNLEYGKYTFIVKAALPNGIESAELKYSFEILTPWWHTWWARILYAIAIILVIILIVKWRTRNLIRKQKDLEHKIEIATHDLRKEKEQVELQKATIEAAHNEITDSINYAKRIQSAILPSEKSVREHLKNSFIFYRPKDIVAGDFYWLEATHDTVYFAAADCTGHGVPGAMVSVICNGGLNRSVREFSLMTPGEILHKTRELVIQEFEKSEDDVKDGMDIALCKLKGKVLSYSGANNPLWVIRNGEILETKADKQPIGKHMDSKPFTTHTLELEKGDTLYIFSDGYSDQFGGPKGKKYKSVNFKKFLLSIQEYSMEEQYNLLKEEFENWRGDLEQLDDICIIGVRI